MCRKKKRVIHPRYHSPCQTPYTALRSLLSVALSSGMVKSNLIIPFISDKVNVQPFRRHCSVISDEGVQFKTARVFNSTAIFNCPTKTMWCYIRQVTYIQESLHKKEYSLSIKILPSHEIKRKSTRNFVRSTN